MTNDRYENLLSRIETLENEARSWRRAARRYRRGAAGVAALAVAALGVSQAAAPRPDDIVQTQRLEIVDAEGRLIVAASGDASGGRVDLWTSDGHNILRLASNENGGDLNVWNREEKSVVAAWAGESGGELGLWDQNGARFLRSAAGEHGGRIEVADRAGTVMAAMRADERGGALAVHNAAGAAVASMSSSAAGVGRFEARAAGERPIFALDADDSGTAITLADVQGRPRLLLSGAAEGGGVTIMSAADTPSVVAGTTTATGGGFVDVLNGLGARVVTMGAGDDRCGRLDLGAENGTTVVSLDAIPEVGGALAILRASGKKSVLVGTREEGGLVNVFNRHEVPVFVASYAQDGLAGAASIMNERGLPVIHSTADAEGRGTVTVYDAEGRKPRSLQPLR